MKTCLPASRAQSYRLRSVKLNHGRARVHGQLLRRIARRSQSCYRCCASPDHGRRVRRSACGRRRGRLGRRWWLTRSFNGLARLREPLIEGRVDAKGKGQRNVVHRRRPSTARQSPLTSLSLCLFDFESSKMKGSSVAIRSHRRPSAGSRKALHVRARAFRYFFSEM